MVERLAVAAFLFLNLTYVVVGSTGTRSMMTFCYGYTTPLYEVTLKAKITKLLFCVLFISYFFQKVTMIQFSNIGILIKLHKKFQQRTLPSHTHTHTHTHRACMYHWPLRFTS